MYEVYVFIKLYALVFNLVHGIDERQTEERVAAYEKEFQDLIVENRAKQDLEDRKVVSFIEDSRSVKLSFKKKSSVKF